MSPFRLQDWPQWPSTVRGETTPPAPPAPSEQQDRAQGCAACTSPRTTPTRTYPSQSTGRNRPEK